MMCSNSNVLKKITIKSIDSHFKDRLLNGLREWREVLHQNHFEEKTLPNLNPRRC
jgi:hypothetical protein